MAVPTFTEQIAFATDPIAAYVDQVLGLTPSVYLRLGDTVGSGTAADASGNGNTGTVNGGVTFGQTGLISGDPDTAALFNGTTGYITLADATTLNPTTALTLLFWLNMNSTATQMIYQKGSIVVELGGTPFLLQYQASDSNGQQFGGTYMGEAGLVTGTPYFIAITDDGTNLAIYVNGALKVSKTRQGAAAPGTTVTTGFSGVSTFTGYVGVAQPASSLFYSGVLDEFALIADTALTSTQISQLYSARTIPTSTVWTTLTGGEHTTTVTRGKLHELDQVQAGQATVSLLNLNRALDPTNTASPYYPNVLPLRRYRRQATINSTTYSMFTGYATRYPQNRTGPTYAEVQFQAVDGFEPLQQAIITGTLPAELSGARIKRVLNLAGWAQADRNIDAGSSTMAAVTFAATDKKTALAHIQDVEQSERGLFFIAGNGQATFVDRHSMLTSPYNTSQATFSDKPAGGEYGYQNIVVSYDRDQIWNDWTDTRTGGTAQNAQDAPSIQSYFRRSQSLTSQLASNADSLYLVQWLLSLYKSPLFRVESITLRPGNNTAFWQAVLARELGDRITVKGSPPGGGPQFVKDCFIAQINMQTPKHAADTTVTWQLTSADTIKYLVLNDSVQGQLDSNAIAW